MLDNINGYPLDTYQSKVVLSNCKASLVIAGAGSGKSLTIIGKVNYLIKECNIKPNEILCISFTNDATVNLKNNLLKQNINIDIYTFHKLSLKILHDNNYTFDIAPDTLLDDIIDNFFNNIIPNNKLYTKSLNIILGKKHNKQSIINLKRLIKTFISLFSSNDYNFSYYLTILNKIKYTLNIKQYYINKHIILLTLNIHLIYINTLKENNSIDFNDMINKCTSILNNNTKLPNWKYIIIDEYQDTSITKFNLINKLINITNANLLAVGDDFQSIYRFTGCNLHIFLNFTKYFKYAKTFQIINTYRNPQELINISGSFIMKNKSQIKKKLLSSKHITNPIYLYETDNYIKTLKIILNKIKDQDIFILGRNNKDILKYIDNTYTKLDNDYYTYNDIKFRYLTIHKSKGLESSNIILINMEDNLLGLPSKIKDEQILKYVNNTKDYYPYEEERRLFYVALTRTKNRVYIIAPIHNQSIFLKEIKKYTKKVN